ISLSLSDAHGRREDHALAQHYDDQQGGELEQSHDHGDGRGVGHVELLEGLRIGRDRDGTRGARGLAQQDGRRKRGEAHHEDQGEGDREPGGDQGQHHAVEHGPGPCAQRACRVLERRIDARDVAEQHEEAERELLHEERQHHSDVVVGEDQWLLEQARAEEHLVEPSLAAVKAENPYPQQDHAERDGQHQDRGDGALKENAAPHVVGEEEAQDHHDHRVGNGEAERDAYGLVLIFVVEESEVVGETEAGHLHRVHAQPDSVQERVDEHHHHVQHRWHKEDDRHRVELARLAAARAFHSAAMKMTFSGGSATVTFSPRAKCLAVRTQRRLPLSSVTITSVSRPRYSTISTWARNALSRPFSPITTSSGRMAATTAAPGLNGRRVLPWICMPWPEASRLLPGPAAVTRAGKKLRKPMKSATNRFAGWSWISCGGPACTSRPSRITTIQSESESASVWSWVT